jgi:hypothetical protein
VQLISPGIDTSSAASSITNWMPNLKSHVRPSLVVPHDELDALDVLPLDEGRSHTTSRTTIPVYPPAVLRNDRAENKDWEMWR